MRFIARFQKINFTVSNIKPRGIETLYVLHITSCYCLLDHWGNYVFTMKKGYGYVHCLG